MRQHRTRTYGPLALLLLVAAGFGQVALPTVDEHVGDDGGDGGSPLASSAPNPPLLVAPLDGSGFEPTDPVLTVDVSDPDGDPLDVTFYGREIGNFVEDFTIVVLPDTQFYAETGSPIFSAQTQWIVDNKDARNIVYVAHLGDCVEHGELSTEWDVADAAMSLLENPVTTMLADGLPYGIAVGNKDQDPPGAGDVADEGATTALYNSYFGVPRFQGRGYYGGHFGINNDNHYDLFSVAGMDFIVIYTEFDMVDGPLRQNVLAWADGLLATFGDRRAIVVSHSLMKVGFGGDFGEQGLATYEALKANPNLFLMLAGHHAGEGQRTDVFSGNTVHTVLADYQARANGGDGWLRIMEFSPINDEIRVSTYSPTLDAFETDADSQFTLRYNMDPSGPFLELGLETGVPSGAGADFVWSARAAGSTYEWYAVAGDGSEATASAVWDFTVTGDCTEPVECDDGNPCTVNDCVEGVCRYYADDSGTCSDGRACTIDDRCESSVCVADDGCPAGEFCDPDGDSCEAAGDEPLPIPLGETWRYFKGTSEPPAAWTDTFDDSTWLSGPSGFGFGDGDDATVLDDMRDGYVSLYIRQVFHVPDKDRLTGLELRMDYDDAHVTYINGVEVARSPNITGNPPLHSDSADSGHEAGTPVLTNLDAFLGLLRNGDNVFAVQGHNATISSSDFSLAPDVAVRCDDADACTSDVWDPLVGCRYTCDDGDACTVGDACNGAGTCRGTPLLPPSEVQGLVVDAGPPTHVGWTSQGGSVLYDVAGGLISELHADGGTDAATCLHDDEAGDGHDDARPQPPAGDGYYYVVRGQHGCGTGSYGSSSAGSQRTVSGDCP